MDGKNTVLALKNRQTHTHTSFLHLLFLHCLLLFDVVVITLHIPLHLKCVNFNDDSLSATAAQLNTMTNINRPFPSL